MTDERLRVREDLRALEGYHSPQLDVTVRLNTNESPEPPPAAWSDDLADALRSVQWHRYPDRAAHALRAGIGAEHGFDVSQVFAANGSNEVLQTALLAYGGPGRSAAVFEPTYALHAHIARITGTAVIEGERSEDLSLDVDVVLDTVRNQRPAVTFLCSPNNPTGLTDPVETVEQTLEMAESVGGLLIVDEAYGQFAASTALDLVGEDRSLAVTRTFSKTWSMAAARLGYLIGPSWLVAELDKVVLPYHLDAVTQLAGEHALKYRAEMELRVAALVEERGRLMDALRQLPVEVWPSGANFVLFRPIDRNGNRVWQGLVDRSVLVRNCASWPRLDNCLRVTVGSRRDDDTFLAALTEVLAMPERPGEPGPTR